jgi:hypothetical protein
VDDGVDVELQLADDGRLVLVLERAERHDAGVVDQDVERPEPPLDLVEQRGEGRPVGHVERKGDGRGAQSVGHGCGGGGVEVGDRHPGPAAGRGAGDRGADPPSPARDQHDLSGK